MKKTEIPQTLFLGQAEEIVRRGPLDILQAISEIIFGSRSIALNAVFYPEEMKEVTDEWLVLLEKTFDILYSLKNTVDAEFKDDPLLTNKRVLSSREKLYLLEKTRGTEISKVTAAFLMPSDENRTMVSKSLENLIWTINFLRTADKSEIIEKLKQDNLYPIEAPVLIKKEELSSIPKDILQDTLLELSQEKEVDLSLLTTEEKQNYFKLPEEIRDTYLKNLLLKKEIESTPLDLNEFEDDKTFLDEFE